MTEQMTSSGKVEAAREVAGRTSQGAGAVAGEAQEQVRAAARQAKDQVRDLVERGRSDVGDEAAARSRQAAGSVRTLADRVGALANGDPEAAGPLADLLREGQDRLQVFAGRLDDGPSAVLDDVRRFARRQPVLFLASAGALGFLAGRFVRAGREAGSNGGGQQPFGTLPMGTATAGLPPVTPVGYDAPGTFEAPVDVGCRRRR
jgi:ElaB/YqjD/DUF883 family membrane-anchored ribosome-binding protein